MLETHPLEVPIHIRDGILVSVLTRPVEILTGALVVDIVITLEALKIPLIGPLADSM